MNWFSKAAGIAMLVALTAVPCMAAHRAAVWPRIVQRPVIARPYAPVIVRPYFYNGPAWYGYPAARYYSWAPAYVVGPITGEVKIETHLKHALVYVDGGYVGPIDKFKKFHLRPGNHDIELRDVSGATLFRQRVHVIEDKTTEIRGPE
jgi:hypothetical protein